MDKEQALGVLLQVAELAQSKGILNLKDATVVFQAVTTLAPEKENVAPVAEVEPQPQPKKGSK